MLVGPSEFTYGKILLLSVSCVCLDLHAHSHRCRHLGPDAFVLHDYLILWLSRQPTYWTKTNKNTNKSLLCPSHLYHLCLCGTGGSVILRLVLSTMFLFTHSKKNNGFLKTVCVRVSHFHSNVWSRPSTLVPHQLPHLTRLLNWS